jgi:uncharacterized protein with gpF-like domain
VARTEVISGYNGGTLESIAQTPDEITAGKEWISSIDDRTRDWHIPPDGQIRKKDEAFDVNGEQLMYPGDSSGGSGNNTIMCRCTVAPVAPEDMPGARARTSDETRAENVTQQALELTVNVNSGTVKRVIERDADGRITGMTEVTE